MIDEYSYIIIDDEPKAIKILSNSINRLCGNLNMIGSYTDWEPALSALNNSDTDIAFLDISMPRKSGFGLLELIPELPCEIIFVTAHEEYALKAFKFSPIDYLLKPVADDRLSNAINKATEHIRFKSSSQNQLSKEGININNKIGIRNNNGLDYVNIDDIIFFEAKSRYTSVVTRNKKYVSTNNLGKFKTILDGQNFYNVHRSFIVNTNHILRYESSGVLILTDGYQIPVAKNTRGEFLKLFNRY